MMIISPPFLGSLAARALCRSRALPHVRVQRRRRSARTWPSDLRWREDGPFNRLQDRHLSLDRERQGALGEGELLPASTSDSEFGDSAGDRRRRRSDKDLFKWDGRYLEHRGLGNRYHTLPLAIARVGGAGLSGDRPAPRAERMQNISICSNTATRDTICRRIDHSGSPATCAANRGPSRSISSTAGSLACLPGIKRIRNLCAIPSRYKAGIPSPRHSGCCGAHRQAVPVVMVGWPRRPH